MRIVIYVFIIAIGGLSLASFITSETLQATQAYPIEPGLRAPVSYQGQ